MNIFLIAALMLSNLKVHYEIRYVEASPENQARVTCKIDQQAGENIRPDYVIKGFVKNVPMVQDFEKSIGRAETLNKAMKECRSWIDKEKKEIIKTQAGKGIK